MTNFVMGLFAVQLLMGAYLFSITVPSQTARATRLPASVLLTHPLLGLAGATMWLIWMFTDDRGWVWASFATVLLAAIGGGVLGLKSRLGGPVEQRPEAREPADVRVVEKQVPKPAMHIHGASGTVLLICMLLVGIGVVG